LFVGLLPILPTAQRVFGRTDTVKALLRLYQTGRSAAQPVIVDTLILDTENTTRFRDTRVIAPEAFAVGHADYSLDLPGGLAPGEYLLEAGITSGSESARSAVRYQVR
jgi:hypothetical protein